MLFLAPLWLTLLVPWAALVAWLWRRVADERPTTAAFLWQHEMPERTTQRTNRRRPPAWVMSALAAMLFAIAALANPAVAARAARVAVVVDGSVALSAKVNGGSLRDGLLDQLQESVRRSAVDVALDVRAAGVAADVAHELGAARSFPFTARSTAEPLVAAVREAARTADAVVVVSGQSLPPLGDRVAVVTATDEQNVGIVTAVAVAVPRPSLMVRVLSSQQAREATVAVHAGEWRTQQHVSLPGQHATTDTFIDLPPSPGDVIEVKLTDAADGLAIDDEATLQRVQGWPTLVLAGDVPPAATRFAAAYAQARGNASNSGEIRIGTTLDDAELSPQLILAPPTFAATGDVTASDSPLVHDVDFAKPPILRIAAPPPSEWTTVASVGGRPIVCVRERPARAVWFGFDLDPTELRSVVLLSNAIDWLSTSNATEWRGESPDAIGADWRMIEARSPAVDASPGIYLDSAGRRIAVNVPAITSDAVESRGDVVALLRSAARDTRRSLRPWLALIAGGCVMMAALFMRGRRQS